MTPTTIQPTAEQQAWQEAHRCAICNALPVRIESNMVDEYRTLKPEHRHLATIPVPAEPWQTEHIGGEWRTEIECENGHVFSAHHIKFVNAT